MRAWTSSSFVCLFLSIGCPGWYKCSGTIVISVAVLVVIIFLVVSTHLFEQYWSSVSTYIWSRVSWSLHVVSPHGQSRKYSLYWTFLISTISALRHWKILDWFSIPGQWLAPGSPNITTGSPVFYLMSLWWFAWAGGGGTKEPVMTQGAPEAGREVGLMYSFSSQSDDGFSALDTADAGRDLFTYRQHKAWWDCLDLAYKEISSYFWLI